MNFQPVYNYCKFFEPSLGVDGKTCEFNRDTVVKCPDDAEYTFAPFEMDSSVATENNMVRFDLNCNFHPLLLLLQYCGQYIWTPTVDSFFMIGLLVGSFIFGSLVSREFSRFFKFHFLILLGGKLHLRGAL